MIKRFRTLIAQVAAIGGVKRRGIGALKSYGGTIEGEGHVIRNSGPDKGKKIPIKLSGNVSQSNAQ